MEYIREAWENVELAKKIGAAVGDLINISETVDEDLKYLKMKVEKLGYREEDVKKALEAVERQSGKKRKREVENWLENVGRKKIEVEQRLQAVTESRLLSRLCTWRLVQKDIKEVTELFDQGCFNDGLWIDVGPSEVELIVPSVVLPTARQKIDEIWKCLMNDQTLIIGVYGIAGVGKTIIASHINNRLLSNSSFGHVFWVAVPRQSSNYEYDLQNSIAKTVGLDLSGEEDKRKRAAMLFKFLKSKKFVLILDDIWEIFQPKEIGIPLGVNTGKLLLTTRMLNVCQEIQCQEKIEIRRLSPEESWGLFLEELGRDLSPQLEEFAKSVARECAGLPLAIVAVARSMRGEEEIGNWRNALNELQDPTMVHINRRNEIFKQLKFSYDHLRKESDQQCLLYCALFPEDWEIERNELIAYWIGEGLIRRMTNRQEEFDWGNAIIKRLTDACLLETTKQFNGRSFVKMNNAVRDMALAIASESPFFMVKAGVRLTQFPSQLEWSENLDRVSLMCNYLKGCSSSTPNCPMLKTLMLQHNEELNRLPHSFFTKFRRLSVLDLSGSRIESLPNTIIDLEELRVLILRGCKSLKRIPSFFHKLKYLVELDLGFTGLCTLPKGIEKLVNLRVLDFSWTCMRRSFPSAVLESLSLLQCLKLEGCKQVQPEAISSLEHLETLYIDFCDILSYTTYLNTPHWQNLSLYSIGCKLSEHHALIDAPYKNLRTVTLSGCHSIGSVCEMADPLVLPANMQQLHIDNCSNITSLLQRLQLRRFDSLLCLTVTSCPALRHLFSNELAEDALVLLDKLKLMQVCNCSDLEEIICQYDHANIVFPRHLVLHDLPKLNNICSSTMLCHLVEEIEVDGCPLLKRLPVSMHEEGGQTYPAVPPSLKKIQGRREWWDSLEWDHPDAKRVLQNVFCELNEGMVQVDQRRQAS